jgi:hypothetical protein
MPQAGRSQVQFVIKAPDFSVDIILSASLYPLEFDSASEGNENQESFWE